MLGPILFLIFINDLPEVILSFIKLFADDAKLFGRVNSIMQGLTVQGSLDNSVDWTKLWKMNYHFKKCKHLHVGNHDLNIEYTMQTEIGEFKVEKVQSEKNLGVIFDQKLKFTEHVISKVHKANRNVGLIFQRYVPQRYVPQPL